LCRCTSFCGASMIQRHLSKTFLSQSTILRPDVIFCDWIDLNCMRDGLQLQSLSFRLHSVSRSFHAAGSSTLGSPGGGASKHKI
jgi:hypothetical protein